MPTAEATTIRFASFRLDLSEERLWDGSDPISLRPKTWAVLRYLVENAGRLIPKGDLLDVVWGDTAVEEKAVNTCIGEIRVALGDSSRHPRFIETVQRRGFRFIANVGPTAAQITDEASRLRSRFIGRRDELEQLADRLSRSPGDGPLTVVCGSAGIGKSRLVSEAVRRIGTLPLVGQCIEGGGLPYLPWVEVIRDLLRQRPGFEWRRALGGAAVELERLIPALTEGADASPQPSSDPELARIRLFEAIASFLEAASRGGEQLVLIVEDIHWIDAASLRALQVLVPRLQGTGASVVATLRDEDAPKGSSVRLALDALSRRNLVRLLPLQPMPAADARELVTQLAGTSLSAALIDRIAQDSEGSPFFAEEMVRCYAQSEASRPGAEHPSDGALDLVLPDNVVEVFERRRRRLSPSTQRLLEAMAVAGKECDELLLEQLMPSEDLVAALDEAIEHNVLRENAARRGRYGFAHALMALATYQNVSSPARRRWHRELAEALGAIGAQGAERSAQLARHLAEAVPLVPVDRAVDALLAACDYSDSRLAYEDAVQHCATALRLVEASSDVSSPPARLPELALRYAEALQKIGDAEKAAPAFRQAAATARRAGDSQWLARAALGMATIWDYDAPDVRDYLEEALQRLGKDQPALRARLLAKLAVVLYPLPETRPRCEELTTQAVSVARAVGDTTLLAQTLVDWLAGRWYQDNLSSQRAVSEELLRTAERSGDGALLATALGWRVVIALGIGDMARVREATAQLFELAPRLGQPLYQWFALYLSATLALLRGELELAESLATQAFELGRSASPQSATVVYFTQMLLLRREQDRIGEIIPLIEANPSRMTSDALVWTLPHFYLEADRIDAGRDAFARACALGFDAMPGENSRNRRLMTLGAMALACAALDKKEEAALLYGRLAPEASRWGVAGWGVISYGMLENPAGALAACLGEYDRAADHFERAIAEYHRQEVIVPLARAYWLYAEMRLRRGRPGDENRALGLLAEASRLADDFGLTRIRVLADRLRGTPPAVHLDCR